MCELQGISPNVKRMFNMRRNLLRIEKIRKDGHHVTEIRALKKVLETFGMKKKIEGQKCCERRQWQHLEGCGGGKRPKSLCHSW